MDDRQIRRGPLMEARRQVKRSELRPAFRQRIAGQVLCRQPAGHLAGIQPSRVIVRLFPAARNIRHRVANRAKAESAIVLRQRDRGEVGVYDTGERERARIRHRTVFGLAGVFFDQLVLRNVEKDGSLTDIKVIRDIGYGTGKEAIRVLKKCPKWTPGEQNGKKVRVLYSLPITIQSAE